MMVNRKGGAEGGVRSAVENVGRGVSGMGGLSLSSSM